MNLAWLYWFLEEDQRYVRARDVFDKNLAFIDAGEKAGEDETQKFLSCFHNQQEFFDVFDPSNRNEAMDFFIIFMEKWPSHNDKLISQLIHNTSYREDLFGCDNFLKRVSQMKSETAKNKVVKAILDNPDIYFSVFQNKNVLLEFCREFPAYKQQAEKQFRLFVVSCAAVSEDSHSQSDVEPSNTMKDRLRDSDQHFKASLAKIASGERLYK